MGVSASSRSILPISLCTAARWPARSTPSVQTQSGKREWAAASYALLFDTSKRARGGADTNL